jgi:hypothetical protein
MNSDVENLLREGMERFTRDLWAPAGLTRRVAQRRRRRLVLRSAAGAAATLTAAAVALAAVEVPSALHSDADATAYVVKRVDSALNAAEPDEIAQMTVTTRSAPVNGGTTTTANAEEWSYGNQWRSVVTSQAGRPVYDQGSSSSSASVTVYTLVSYLARTWARQHEQRPSGIGKAGPGGCELGAAGTLQFLFEPGLAQLLGFHNSGSSLSASVPRALHSAISCGSLKVAGRQQVDGVDAIKLTTPPVSPASETIWVSPGTYLPLRVVIRSDGPHHGLILNNQVVLLATADITWLPPTAQNLAKLTVPIPAGFRKVSLPAVAAPTFKQISPALLPRPRAFCLMPAVNACGNPPFPVGGPPLGSGYR